MTNPSLASAALSQLKALVIAVEKFGMDVLADTIDDALIAFAARGSVAVYAAGCQLRRPRVIEAAARRTLEEPFMAGWSTELSAVTGEQYYRLLDYHRQCSEAAGKLALSNWKWIDSVANIPLAGPSQECACTMLVTYNSRLEGSILNSSTTTAKNTYMVYIPGWWWNYMKSAEAALKKTPCSAVITGDELLGPALTKSIDCNNKSCRTGVREAMASFSQRFAQQVDKVINEVSTVPS
ncbi:hypothetical protein EWM64_g2207 [Hericium alpestre]|uniref:Uncharacterized protein n=1 Tax=Hericium alpestre TaxID=135208 RepID=A0A4Z0A516_9AGAM|nr:hypothetical protein EWM64_g2207 [Hericium alpestre]